ncbi:MAG TPA: GNAT family N-acetyltransferase [Longimicrobiales bacterium]|nr:GNAT family N-acetyltransferase [Longimicrobiales bacterium]
MHSGFTIRPLADYQEMKRAVDFQRVIWGSSFNELVPAVVFWATTRTGGIAAGAFDGHGAMLGLIFGITGWDGERPLHWSDMLGVHPDARGRGIGLALKQYQRERLLEAGVTLVQWTFDPLEARNAHINFARLGATAHEYIRDCYGASTSPLHRGIGTDRLVAEWRLDSDRVRRRMGGEDAGETTVEEALLINPEGEPLRLDLVGPHLWLRIPPDIQALKERDAVAARRWREHTRAALEAYLGRGYEVRDMVRGADESRYVLSST